eukprot:jgi/Chrpa1/8365/Chrysochromulina_OHIO_Genome00019086-RA
MPAALSHLAPRDSTNGRSTWLTFLGKKVPPCLRRSAEKSFDGFAFFALGGLVAAAICGGAEDELA